ncbi:ComF family protein [Candidatus Kaiserbacteria bacterium]|nr:ComF family protein [Candidatus Kaiserbacteria bacterium]
MFNTLYKTLLDIIFPQNAVEQRINTLPEDFLFEKLRIQEHGSIVSLFRYKDPLIKQMVWLLKYKKSIHVAHLFALTLYDYLIEELSDETVFSEGTQYVIVPIPLSKKRERERGYNQMKLITNELQKLGGLSVSTQMLIKKRHTYPQTSLRKKEDRVHNIKGVFEVRNTLNLSHTHVILIDDVLTTGSTLKEASRVLKDAGVYKVSCITLTH